MGVRVLGAVLPKMENYCAENIRNLVKRADLVRKDFSFFVEFVEIDPFGKSIDEVFDVLALHLMNK